MARPRGHFRRRRWRRRDRRVFRRRFRLDDLKEDEIKARFRFSTATIFFLLDILRPALTNATRRSKAVSPLLQLLAALRFFATGAFFRLVGDSLGLSQSVVCRSVRRVSQAIADLAPLFINFPTGAAVAETQHRIYTLSRFPSVVSAVDCTQVRIQAPKTNEVDFVNRKGYHSLNIQMTCDPGYLITNCVANWPGSVHDARIFRNSSLCQNYENGQHEGLLVGDSGYPCRPFLMTPFLNPSTNQEHSFNRSLCRARVAIEQTFGILKRRFPCLKMGLRVAPDRAAVIVMACAVLHNIAINRNEPVHADGDDQQDDGGNGPAGGNQAPIPGRNDGAAIRRNICQNYF